MTGSRAAACPDGEEVLVGDSVVLTRVDEAVGWARKFSLFPYPFATACCAMEYMSLSMSPYDIDRFGALLPLGYNRPELVGKTLWEVSPFQDVAANQEAFRGLQQAWTLRERPVRPR